MLIAVLVLFSGYALFFPEGGAKLAIGIPGGGEEGDESGGGSTGPALPPPSPDPRDYSLQQLELGISYQPLADEKQVNLTLESLPELGADRIRISEDWAEREPADDEFDWDGLDEKLNFFEQNNFLVILTIESLGPDWVCDPELKNEKSCVFTDSGEFREYIENLLMDGRAAKIDKIQFGNEWPSTHWFIGPPETLVEYNNILYSEVQKIPENERPLVALGGLPIGSIQWLAFCDDPPWIDEFIAGDGSAVTSDMRESICPDSRIQEMLQRVRCVLEMEPPCEEALFDALDLHLYDDVENWSAYTQMFRSWVPFKPFIASEFGGPNILAENYTDDYHNERFYLYVKKLDEEGFLEGLHFRLEENRMSPLRTSNQV